MVQSNISPARMIQPIAGLPQPSRMRQVILLGLVPASCFEHSLLSKLRLALFGKRVRIIPLTNTNFIISCGGGFDEPRKHFKPSHTPPHTSRSEPSSGFAVETRAILCRMVDLLHPVTTQCKVEKWEADSGDVRDAQTCVRTLAFMFSLLFSQVRSE